MRHAARRFSLSFRGPGRGPPRGGGGGGGHRRLLRCVCMGCGASHAGASLDGPLRHRTGAAPPRCCAVDANQASDPSASLLASLLNEPRGGEAWEAAEGSPRSNAAGGPAQTGPTLDVGVTAPSGRLRTVVSSQCLDSGSDLLLQPAASSRPRTPAEAMRSPLSGVLTQSRCAALSSQRVTLSWPAAPMPVG